MWSEEINKKIEEAEGSNNPAYNDKAWDQMELLLDKHLPQEKKRRRFILLLLPLILAGGAIFFILQQKRTHDIAVTMQENTIAKPSSSSDKIPGDTGNKTTPSKKIPGEPEIEETPPKNNLSEISTQSPSTPAQQQVNSRKIKPTLFDNDDRSQSFLRKKTTPKTVTTVNNNIVSETPAIPDMSASVDNSVSNNSTTSIKTNAANPVSNDSTTTQKTFTVADKKQEDTAQAEITKTKIKDPKSKPSIGSKFSLNLSFGPDISGVGIDNPGKLEMLYGIGVGYALSKRLTVRTGFFAVSKIYTADSGDYKTTYPINKLQKIDANCLVYEIPVTLVYNFPTVKKHNWFISGGLSSYLMKKETYGYHYENSWGQPQYYKRSYKNENTHLFSVINFSGGYQYNFSDRFSIMAEPYIKIPTSGVGEGKVKLNSAGMLFTVGFKPFVRKN